MITLATVGYGDFTPKTDAGKLFTVVYVLIGVGILLSFVTRVAGQVVQTHMHDHSAENGRPHLRRVRPGATSGPLKGATNARPITQRAETGDSPGSYEPAPSTPGARSGPGS